ncbi:type III pantothenate kinase [Lewinella marina]|uniref:Type III pantothenate kinase n=1 Tax=Neolewinella marina TaxID=438751 RepID=A0A2G0CD26_9BACT|nr:type III pantothenate kinase [Neolewinella marina]NJB86975.1 type III pantothenate kinase [Neolewinella marina]PHK97830.1 pantothenate kinase [Neolewinella marina]
MGTPNRRLIVDVGNSGLKAACFEGDELLPPVARLPAGDWGAIDAMATNLGVNYIIYSTVANVPSERWTDKWKQQGRQVYALDRSKPLPFASDYRTPETLGQDRIAAVAGTLGTCTTARLVVDAGSCVTYDLVDATDRYRGGNISPGVNMRLRAMHEQTARLPLVSPGKPEGAVGRSTGEALQHGGLLGVVYEAEGLYHRLLADHGDLQLVLTGGDAPLLLPYFSVPCVHSPNLVLRGLNQILSAYVNAS